MDRINKNFGFGFMRLPTTGEDIDIPRVCEMVDAFLDAGFNYFDTAHLYFNGKSELAIGECLSARHPRESFVLTNKLTAAYFNTEEDIRPFFAKQLADCRVDYFDFYFMHAQRASNFGKFKQCRAYETALELKDEGLIRHLGISFHDRPEVLEQILTEYPQVEVVQLQFNYLDFDDPAVKSKECYDVCVKYGKPVFVMEPIKGGTLADLPDDAQAVFDRMGGSPASYALRYAAGFENNMMVLSGMSTIEQLRENIAVMGDFHPLDNKELAAVEEVRALFAAKNLIPCTSCRYCTEGCPMEIAIPDLFACLNGKKSHGSRSADHYYEKFNAVSGGKASDCIGCGACEGACPQQLPIRELLAEVAAAFEK